MYVPQDLIRDRNMTDVDVATWCLCSIEVFAPWKDSSLITVSQLAYQMHNTMNVAHSIKEEIGISLQHLLEENYLIGERRGKQYYEVFKESFNMDNYEYFVNVDENAIRKIFKHLRPYSVLRAYLLILTTINSKTKCSSWSKERLAELIGKDTTTITRYNKFFEDEKLLYIYHAKPAGEGVYFTNVYSRYEDREAARKYGDSRSGNNGETADTNLKRRYAQMYNMIKAGKKFYSPEEMQEVRAYCEAENERRQKIYAKNPSYDQKLYDISILI